MPIVSGNIPRAQPRLIPSTPNPAAQVNIQPSGGPGQGGASTASTAASQLPAAQAAAGMAPTPPPQAGAPGAAPAPAGGGGMQPGAYGQQALQQGTPPMPGRTPNSQGQVMYEPGQGPVTEQVPPMDQMPVIAPQATGAPGMKMGTAKKGDCGCGCKGDCGSKKAWWERSAGMEQTATGDGDTSKLKWRPWTSNGEDAWDDTAERYLRTGPAAKARAAHDASTALLGKVDSTHKSGEFADAFVAKCAAAGFTLAQIKEAAVQYGKVSPSLAAELSSIQNLTKASAPTGWMHGLGMPSMRELGHFYGQAPGSVGRVATSAAGGATGGGLAGSVLPGPGTMAGAGGGGIYGLGRGLANELSRGTEAPETTLGSMASNFGRGGAGGAVAAAGGVLAGKAAPYLRSIPGVGGAMDAAGSGMEALGGMVRRGMQSIPGMGGAGEAGMAQGSVNGAMQDLAGAGKSQAAGYAEEQAQGFGRRALGAMGQGLKTTGQMGVGAVRGGVGGYGVGGMTDLANGAMGGQDHDFRGTGAMMGAGIGGMAPLAGMAEAVPGIGGALSGAMRLGNRAVTNAGAGVAGVYGLGAHQGSTGAHAYDMAHPDQLAQGGMQGANQAGGEVAQAGMGGALSHPIDSLRNTWHLLSTGQISDEQAQQWFNDPKNDAQIMRAAQANPTRTAELIAKAGGNTAGMSMQGLWEMFKSMPVSAQIAIGVGLLGAVGGALTGHGGAALAGLGIAGAGALGGAYAPQIQDYMQSHWGVGGGGGGGGEAPSPDPSHQALQNATGNAPQQSPGMLQQQDPLGGFRDQPGGQQAFA